MAVYYARANGNVNGTIWATTPTGTASNLFSSFTNADTLMANSFTVTLNVNTTVLELRTDTANGATTGGQFNLSDGVTITANLVAGSNRCVMYSGNASAAIVGNITGGLTGGSSSCVFYENATGTLNITGNVVGGPAGSGVTISVNSNGIVNITGNVTGAASAATHGVSVGNLSVVNITGTATGGGNGGYGVFVNVATATVNITGTAVGGSGLSSAGAFVQLGTLNVTRAKGNGFGNGSVGLSSSVGVGAAQTGIARVSEIEYGDLGQSPTSGPIIFTNSTSNVALFYRLSGGKKTLVDNSIAADFPATSNVRSGVSYASGNLTGTLAMPAAGSVALGVPVDNTTGTAVLTSTAAQSGCASALSSFAGGRLSNCSTVASVAQQISNALTPT